MRDSEMKVHHVLISTGRFVTEETLLDLGEALFKFEERGVGPDDSTTYWVQGKFWQRDGKIVFRYQDPMGYYQIVDDEDITIRVAAYMLFTD